VKCAALQQLQRFLRFGQATRNGSPSPHVSFVCANGRRSPFLWSAQSAAGLPNGIFSNQKSRFGKLLEGLSMKAAAKFYIDLVHFPAI
jgi:hypothetical protein